MSGAWDSPLLCDLLDKLSLPLGRSGAPLGKHWDTCLHLVAELKMKIQYVKLTFNPFISQKFYLLQLSMHQPTGGQEALSVLGAGIG